MQIYACVNYFHDKNTIHKIAMECRRRRQCNTPHIPIPLAAFFASFSAERLSFVRSISIYLRKEMHPGAGLHVASNFHVKNW